MTDIPVKLLRQRRNTLRLRIDLHDGVGLRNKHKQQEGNRHPYNNIEDRKAVFHAIS